MSSKQIYKTSFSLGPYFDIISKLYKVRGIVQAIFLSPSPRLINYLYFASLALSFSLYREGWRHCVLLPRFYGVCPKNKDISYIAIMQWSKSGNLTLIHHHHLIYGLYLFDNILQSNFTTIPLRPGSNLESSRITCYIYCHASIILIWSSSSAFVF